MRNKNISKKRITLGTKQYVPMFEQFLNESEEMEDEDMEMEEPKGGGEDEDMEEEEMESGEGDDEGESEEEEVEERIQEAYRRGLAKGKKLYSINEDNWDINKWVQSPGGMISTVKEYLPALQTVLSTVPAAKETKPVVKITQPNSTSTAYLQIEFMGASSAVFGIYIPLYKDINDPVYSYNYPRGAELESFFVKTSETGKKVKIRYTQSLFQSLISKPLSDVISEFDRAEKIK